MSSTLKAPPIGHPWPGQGGTYAGLCRGRDGQADYHLILADIRPKAAYLSWLAGMAWAKTVTVDGHTDFDLPTRYESPILFGNVGALFEREWHWTSTQSSEHYAFFQGFCHGAQHGNGKKAELRVRAVRRLPINPSVLSTPATHAAEVAA